MKSTPRGLLRPVIGLLAMSAILWAGTAQASDKLVARILEAFEMPAAVSLDPLSDDEETLAAVQAVRDGFRARGLTVSDEAAYVLEIEFDRGERVTGLSRWQESVEAETYAAQQRENPINELAPSDDLAPTGPRTRRTPNFDGKPQFAVTLLLYKHGEPPVWMARATAPRDNRRTDALARKLADLAMAHFGKSAVIGYPNAPSQATE